MKSIIVAGGKLFLVCAVAAVALGFVNAYTEPAIKARKARELREALEALSGGYEIRQGVEVPEAEAGVVRTRYRLEKKGEVEGFILDLAGMGYGGEMKILARFDTRGTVEAVKLMDNEETPGLGKRAEHPEYMRKFVGTGGKGNRPVPVRKDMLPQKEADAVTGATITFMGISKALDAGSRYVEKLAAGGEGVR